MDFFVVVASMLFIFNYVWAVLRLRFFVSL